jgi:septum formation protein
MNHLILASKSPRRIEALKRLKIPFRSIPTNIDESKETRNLNMTPEETAISLSSKKANAVADRFPENFVLGLDTIVIVDNKIIGKPKNRKEAVKILMELNGRWHAVITGFTLINKSLNYHQKKATKTGIKFINHTKKFIEDYVAKGESLDKAGGYAIQSQGRNLIEKIEGDFSNVVGFPEKDILEMLKRVDIHPVNNGTNKTYSMRKKDENRNNQN